ncbi:Uncharacterized protein HZ326_6469 [Fusarium oxysporum f. sp. albedinis]|nr:Uncharacterized protein HZ326_6469 [Fusarium oxysporum f. sp. albedinis]
MFNGDLRATRITILSISLLSHVLHGRNKVCVVHLTCRQKLRVLGPWCSMLALGLGSWCCWLYLFIRR